VPVALVLRDHEATQGLAWVLWVGTSAARRLYSCTVRTISFVVPSSVPSE